MNKHHCSLDFVIIRQVFKSDFIIRMPTTSEQVYHRNPTDCGESYSKCKHRYIIKNASIMKNIFGTVLRLSVYYNLDYNIYYNKRNIHLTTMLRNPKNFNCVPERNMWLVIVILFRITHPSKLWIIVTERFLWRSSLLC